ncbi:MAG: putative RND superfamily exporter protein, partial [Bradymonadia bacterium]
MTSPSLVFHRIIRHRWAVLFLSVAFAVGLGSFTKPEIDTSLRIWFLDDDPDVTTYDRFVERFEGDEFVVFAMTSDDVFTIEALTRVERLAGALDDLPDVLRVNSLTRAEHMVRTDGGLSVTAVVDLDGATPESLARAREVVRADPLLRTLLTNDGRTTVVVAEHRPFEDLADKARFAANARAAAEMALDGQPFRAAGNAFIEEAVQRYTFRDLGILAPLTVVVLVLVTFALFRNFWCTVVPCAVVLLTLISAVGLAGVFGVKLNMITTIVIPLTMAVGIADSVHVIAGYRERLAAGSAREQALHDAWVELLFPCVVTTATTAIGLFSLLAASLQPLREFGWMGASTVIFALFYTLAVVPAVFSLVDPPTPKAAKSTGGWFEYALNVVARLSWRHHRVVLVGVVLGLIISVFGALRISVGADFGAYFLETDTLFQDIQFIDRELGGTSSIDVLVEADDVREPEVLHRIEQAERLLLQFEAIETVDSPATLVRTLHERWTGDPNRNTVPETLPACAQLLSQTEGNSFHERLLVTDYSAGRLNGRVRSSHIRELIDGLPALERELDELFEGVGTVAVTGVGKLIANIDVYIVQSQIRSFLIAFISVALLLGFFFRSSHIGAWALVPNALPIVFVLGLMGWAKIQLDIGTVMVASIMLGLIVDDTVHFLARYQREWLAAGCP